jgi:hypothetical protein
VANGVALVATRALRGSERRRFDKLRLVRGALYSVLAQR